MIYLEDGFFDHHKTMAAGDEAALVYLRALAWLKQQRSTDGRIPKVVLPRLAPVLKGKPQAAGRFAARLVEVGLWHDEDTHWVCHGFVERNEKAIARSQQAADAARKRHAKPVRTQSARTATADADAERPHMRPQGSACVTDTGTDTGTDTDTGTSPLPSPGSHPSVAANGHGTAGSADAVTPTTGWGDPEATGPNETPDGRNRRRALAIRWRDVLATGGTKADVLECNAIVAKALHEADARIVDEQIGWQLEAEKPPRSPGALLTAVRRVNR